METYCPNCGGRMAQVGGQVTCERCSPKGPSPVTKSEKPFDPYYVWLSIPPKNQPPNHYRLLGLDLFETDLDVIENAADRQMKHIRSVATGKYGRQSQELLNEISAARICLLNPHTKGDYDGSLRRMQPPEMTAAPNLLPVSDELSTAPGMFIKLPSPTRPVAPLPSRSNLPLPCPPTRSLPKRRVSGGRLRASGDQTMLVLGILFCALALAGVAGLLWLASQPVSTSRDASSNAGDPPVRREIIPETADDDDLTTPSARAARTEGALDSSERIAPREIGKRQVREITNSIGLKLTYIPAGEFTMGSPESEANRRDSDEQQHRVRISKPFYLGVYEVTQAEYETVMRATPSHFASSGGGKERVTGLDTSRFPVENVSWEEATEFCRRLSALAAERGVGRSYRLPTEAEWEYACRAGKATAFSFGDTLNGREANCNGNYPYGASKGPYLGRTTKVGSYASNEFGLWDMHGNVWEWCSDWYDAEYYKTSPSENPQGPARGFLHALRGGSWYNAAEGCRAAFRSWGTPKLLYSVGFRVVCVLE